MSGLAINSITGDILFQKAKILLQETLGLKNGLNDNLLVNHTIRGEVQLTANQTTYQIPLIATSNAVATNTSNLLSLQDVFVMNYLGCFVAKPSSPTDASYKMFSYGNPAEFTTANVAYGIEAMYANSNLKFTNNQRVVLPYWDLKRHHNAPFYQASGTPFNDSANDTVDGFYPVEPSVVLNGAGNAVLELQLKQALPAVETYQRFIVMVRGILLQNASSIK